MRQRFGVTDSQSTVLLFAGRLVKEKGVHELLDAYERLSKVAKVHFNEMGDPNYVVVASIAKKYLPPTKKP